ncbi:sugar phosphate isomerase/epimerase family protein [Desulfosporosinus sp. FKA]|uniref:sugar phosphate isomerase/epimerase family protein n=1 Tax=Desulfosporosinus sp. FKA TaxID=1969834 RepID=UPI000B497455|nr:sugar phosphate isomerase/epimerase family protein [Desulfosporosinus sp. FKA]
MPELYFSSTLMWPASLEDLFRTAYENGFAGVEFWAQQFAVKGYSVKDFVKMLSIYPLKTMVHSFSWDLNLASLNDEIREASIRETLKGIDLTATLGGFEITVHPGKRTLDTEPEVYYERLRNSLVEISRYAKERHVNVSLEIMEKAKKEFVVSIEALKQLTGNLFNEFFYTLDIAHCDQEEIIFTSLASLDRISKLHVSNRKGKILHTPLRKGDYKLDKLLPRLSNYKLPLVIEGFDDDNEFWILKDNIKFLKENGVL